MKFPRTALTLTCLATPLCLTSCFKTGPILLSGGTTYTLALSPKPASIAAGATVTFTSTVSGGTNSPSWDLSGYAYGNLGSPNVQVGGATFTYTAPATPPVYTGAGSLTTPGTVKLEAFQGGGGYDSATFTITAPVSVSISPATASVALGATQVFNGYAIGAVNNALTPQVNGVAGGSTATGTIAAIPMDPTYGRFTYTAPATMPMTGPTITVTYISQADPTKSASATITLH